MTFGTIGPGELALLFAVALWPALSWWAVHDILHRRPELHRIGRSPLAWLAIVVAAPLVGPYLYVRVARPRVTIGP